jgi:hypothetical protein
LPDSSVADPHHFGKLDSDPDPQQNVHGSATLEQTFVLPCLVSLQVFPDEVDEPAADLLDVVQGEVYANLCSLFPHC